MEQIGQLTEAIKKIEEDVRQIEEDSKTINCYAIFDLIYHSFKCLYDSIKCCFKIKYLITIYMKVHYYNPYKSDKPEKKYYIITKSEKKSMFWTG